MKGKHSACCRIIRVAFIASKLAPTRLCGEHRSYVGASLLAMRPVQSAQEAALTPLLPKISTHQNPDSTNDRHIISRPHRAFLKQQCHDHRGQPAENRVGQVVGERQPAETHHRREGFDITYGTAPMVPTSRPVTAYIGNSHSGWLNRLW